MNDQRKKERKYLVTFQCTTDAIIMERRCKEYGIPGRMIPVPRRISISCGLAWMAEPGDAEVIRRFIREQGLEIEKEIETEL